MRPPLHTLCKSSHIIKRNAAHINRKLIDLLIFRLVYFDYLRRGYHFPFAGVFAYMESEETMTENMLSRLINAPQFEELTNLILTDAGAAAYEISEGPKAALAAAIAEKTGRPVLFVAPGEREAARIAEDISQYIPMGAGTFLPRERQFVRAAMSHEGEWQRLATMSRLRFQEIKVLCVSADMLLWRMTPPELYDEMTVTLNVGDVIEPKELIEKFVAAGFERVDMVEGKGQCAMRGDIVDVYPPAGAQSLRIEFYDD